MPNNYVLLERIELNASAASVTFSNIPQTGYTDLKVVWSARSARTGSNTDDMVIGFNGVNTNLTGRYVWGTGSAAQSGTDTQVLVGEYPTSTATANTFSNCEVYIPNYTGSTNKSFSADTVGENNGTLAYAALTAGLWSQTAAITSVTLKTGSGSNLDANSTFSLYGLAALGTTPAIAPKASGGNIIDYDGTYWIHTFNTSGTFTPQTGLTCDYLVVAGGGGGGGTSPNNKVGGGAGAGGFRTNTGLSVLAQAYAISVGAGGVGGTSQTVNGTKGSDSVFSTITSTGGGFGGGATDSGGTGGSGGGAQGTAGISGSAGNTPSTSPSQGNNGGASTGAANYGGGGGGGAGAVGSTGTGATGGAGGNGTANSYSGTSVTYAGGGGGGIYVSGGAGAGGTGGGGAGGTAGVAGTAGTINLGGGGGGGGTTAGVGTVGGAGGSGIVIIRYLA